MEKLNDYIVLDTETTGLSPYYCRITEISMSRVRNGQVVEKFTSLINPGCHIPESITDITGISDEMVYDKPRFFEIADEIKEFIGRDVIIGHNICFDMRFLNAAFGEELSNTTVDTRCLAKRVFPGLESYRLEALCRKFDICDKQLHRAESDVYLTYKLYEYLFQK